MGERERERRHTGMTQKFSKLDLKRISLLDDEEEKNTKNWNQSTQKVNGYLDTKVLERKR